MDEADKARKTPDRSRPGSETGDNIPHQRFAPPAKMQAPHVSDTSLSSAIPGLGTSVLGKRKATETSILHSDHKSTTDGVPQQPSLEQPAHSRGVSPTSDAKRCRLKSESLEQKYPESADSSGSGLSVGRSAASRASPDATLNLRRPTLSEADSCIADFIQQMRRIEDEQIEVPTARAHSVSGSSGHRVDPYDTNVEKKASSLSIDLPSFGKAIRMGDTVVDFVLEVVELLHDFYNEHQDAESLVFCKKLKAVVAPNKYTQHARSVGLISDPGVGKSLLMNNLLNLIGAAISKSSRMSTTNVRHEYIHAESQLSVPSVAIVHLFDEATINNKIRDGVAKVLEFKHYDQKILGEAFEKGMYDELKQDKSSAMDYLASLVVAPGANPGFDEVSALEKYIMTNSAIEEPEVVQHISDCARSYKTSLAGTTGQVTFAASSLGALQAKEGLRQFAGYTKDPSDPRTPWRLVDKISMYVSSLVLEHGLRLNDVPGINLDTDQSRNETGKEAYKACDVVILLKQYERSSNSQTLLNTFLKCIRDGKDVVLVITHLDSFDNNDELADEEELDEVLRRLVQKEQEAEQDEDFDAEELSNIGKIKYLRRIAIRAEAITKEMETIFRDLQVEWNGCEGATLRVFPVLNKDHSFHVKGYHEHRSDGRPKVPIAQTGLVPLRTHLRSIPAEMMLRTLASSRTDLERLLIAMQLYCVCSKLERKQEIEGFVTEPKEDCAMEIQNVVAVLKEDMETIMENVIYKHKITWKEHGETLSKAWGGKQHNKYLAFCKKKGEHQTAGKRESWNDDIQKIIHVNLVAAFRLMYDKVKRRKSESIQKVTGLMHDIVTKMKGTSTIII
jgi:hypothetical protein